MIGSIIGAMFGMMCGGLGCFIDVIDSILLFQVCIPANLCTAIGLGTGGGVFANIAGCLGTLGGGIVGCMPGSVFEAIIAAIVAIITFAVAPFVLCCGPGIIGIVSTIGSLCGGLLSACCGGLLPTLCGIPASFCTSIVKVVACSFIPGCITSGISSIVNILGGCISGII
jgi:hypothetical protein